MQKKTFSIDNVIIDKSEKIANEFNNFFVSIGHNLEKDITCNVDPLFYVNSVNNSIVVQHVYVAQVRNVITLKQCVDTYVEPITVLINNSFYYGIFPDKLKLARVVPIFKSGDSSKIYNYRLISILHFFSQKYMNAECIIMCLISLMKFHLQISVWFFVKPHNTTSNTISC